MDCPPGQHYGQKAAHAQLATQDFKLTRVSDNVYGKRCNVYGKRCTVCNGCNKLQLSTQVQIACEAKSSELQGTQVQYGPNKLVEGRRKSTIILFSLWGAPGTSEQLCSPSKYSVHKQQGLEQWQIFWPGQHASMTLHMCAILNSIQRLVDAPMRNSQFKMKPY
eukprot:1000038-Amphidinium_carterae.2